ncbi:hypothetical protein BC828DRAFT_409954 [Blastocladiella britannica]|nr:hypothetical protein BC828DRAFT_409954 [Blastocladiella britannica]
MTTTSTVQLGMVLPYFVVPGVLLLAVLAYVCYARWFRRPSSDSSQQQEHGERDAGATVARIPRFKAETYHMVPSTPTMAAAPPRPGNAMPNSRQHHPHQFARSNNSSDTLLPPVVEVLPPPPYRA